MFDHALTSICCSIILQGLLHLTFHALFARFAGHALFPWIVHQLASYILAQHANKFNKGYISHSIMPNVISNSDTG